MNSLNLWEWSQSKPLAIISMNDGGVQTENPEAICDLNSDFLIIFYEWYTAHGHVSKQLLIHDLNAQDMYHNWSIWLSNLTDPKHTRV